MFGSVLTLFLSFLLAACATIPQPEFKKFDFPENAYFGKPDRPYKVIGQVKSKAEYFTLDPDVNEELLCKNYFNGAVQKLIKYAKANGADAVIEIQSVVFYADGQSEVFPKPECSDDGAEGQVLAQGVAVKWAEAKKQ